MKKALILVDIQNDFCKGGSLEVPHGESIVSKVNELMKSNSYDLIVATLDWHPENHSSFISNDPVNGIWTNHCIEDSHGAQLHKDLDGGSINAYIKKGTNTEIDSYSGFFDNDHVSETGLQKLLKDSNITHVEIVGLALDYCVKATAMDAHKLGFKTSVLKDYTKAVNIHPKDGEEALAEMVLVGITII